MTLEARGAAVQPAGPSRALTAPPQSPTSVLSDFRPLCRTLSVQLSRVGALRTGSKNALCWVVRRAGQVTHRFDSDWFLQRAHLAKNPVRRSAAGGC